LRALKLWCGVMRGLEVGELSSLSSRTSNAQQLRLSCVRIRSCAVMHGLWSYRYVWRSHALCEKALKRTSNFRHPNRDTYRRVSSHVHRAASSDHEGGMFVTSANRHAHGNRGRHRQITRNRCTCVWMRLRSSYLASWHGSKESAVSL
jgi:hypothetical protein